MVCYTPSSPVYVIVWDKQLLLAYVMLCGYDSDFAYNCYFYISYRSWMCKFFVAYKPDSVFDKVSSLNAVLKTQGT